MIYSASTAESYKARSWIQITVQILCVSLSFPTTPAEKKLSLSQSVLQRVFRQGGLLCCVGEVTPFHSTWSLFLGRHVMSTEYVSLTSLGMWMVESRRKQLRVCSLWTPGDCCITQSMVTSFLCSYSMIVLFLFQNALSWLKIFKCLVAILDYFL